MSRRLIYLVSLVSVLALVGRASGELVGYWNLDEDGGTTAADSSGNGNDGTWEDGPTVVAGQYGNALAFDGSRVAVPASDSFTADLFQGPFTLTAWINPRRAGNTWQQVFRSIREDGTSNDTLFINNDGRLSWRGRVNNAWAGGMCETAPDVVPADQWTHVAVAGDETNFRIYVNGALSQESAFQTTDGTNASYYIGGDPTWLGESYAGMADDVAVFDHALTEGEVQKAMEGIAAAELAGDPSPDDGAVDMPRDVVLGWSSGEFAAAHDVYLGTSFSDVNDATRANPMDVLVSEGQTDAAYDPPGVLEFGQTYYWRIDEVNAAPDSTIFKGNVWSFTIEPLGYPIESVIATSTGISEAGAGPENTVNGSGLNENDEHSTASGDMWTALPGAQPLSIQYEFDRVYKMHEMLVWNYNVQFELVLGFGLKDVTVEYSENGVDWTALGDVALAQATAAASYTANTTVDLQGMAAKFVRLIVNSGYGPMGQFGLSEVRFLYVPAQAREPQPADGATAVSVDATLGWRAGREAISHDVYLGTDSEALALVDSVSDAGYVPDNLEFGSTYYWRIDEVNEADAIVSWEGELWSFATQAFAVIDDMESYDDEENRIFDTWLDGFVNETGSTVGYFDAPFAEQTIVNGGGQSMPLEYDNSAAPFYSEAELDLGSADWTGNGADSLRLFVSGQAPALFETAEGGIIMNAIGNDIWGNADQFRYAYKSLTGDGSMTARVDALDGSPSTWAKGGVMIRQSTDAGAINTFMALTGGDGGGATYQQRMTADAASVSQHTYTDGPFAPPYWVRVTREGNTLLGYTSPDGENWTQRGDVITLAMTDPVLIGLALTSHNANQANSAEFSDVSTTGNVTGDWQIAEVGVAQPEGNDPEPLYVAVEDTNGNVAVATNPDTGAVARSGWTEWLIPYSEFGGVNLGRVATMYIGVGDRDNPASGGSGLIFIDDVGYGRPAPVE